MRTYIRYKRVKGKEKELEHCSWFEHNHCTRMYSGLNTYCDRPSTCKDKRIIIVYKLLKKLKVIGENNTNEMS